MVESRMQDIIAVVLAAGKSTRMRSQRSKLLHDLCGKPVIQHLVDLFQEVGIPRIILIVGHHREQIQDTLGDACEYVVQDEQLGTGHAMQQALPLIATHPGNLIIFPGDSPFMTAESVYQLVEVQERTAAACTFLTTEFPETPPYGRVIRTPAGAVTRVVEEKDCTEEQRAIREVFTSHYCMHAPVALPLLSRITNDNVKGEYYLTDILGLLTDAGHALEAVPVGDYGMTLGINDRVDLAAGVRRLQDRYFHALMTSGVTLVKPESTYIDVTVQIAPDTIIYPNTVLRGTTRIGPNCKVGPSVKLCDTVMEAGSSAQHVILEQCTVPENATVAPFQYMRQDAPQLQP